MRTGCKRRMNLRVWLAVLLLVLFVGGMSARFWRHLRFKLTHTSSPLIPSKPMVCAQPLEVFETEKVGRFVFTLPSGFVRMNSDSALVDYRDRGERRVVARVERCGDREILDEAKLLLAPGRYTMPRLRRECYAASLDDFRWSMSPQEVRRLDFLLRMKELLSLPQGTKVETLATNSGDGVLLILSRERAVFHWQANAGQDFLVLHFLSTDIEVADWIRVVAASVSH